VSDKQTFTVRIFGVNDKDGCYRAMLWRNGTHLGTTHTLTRWGARRWAKLRARQIRKNERFAQTTTHEVKL
jgi:hypothetical protein